MFLLKVNKNLKFVETLDIYEMSLEKLVTLAELLTKTIAFYSWSSCKRWIEFI